MLYSLLVELSTELSVLNVFRFITFRTAVATLTALTLSLLLGPALIRALGRLQIGRKNSGRRTPQPYREAGNPDHGRLAHFILCCSPGPIIE